MRMIIKNGRGRLPLILIAPNVLITSALTRRIVSNWCKKNDVALETEGIKALQKALKEAARQMKKQPLIEVQSSNGECLKIIL